MAYKFQLGEYTASGSLIQEGDLTAVGVGEFDSLKIADDGAIGAIGDAVMITLDAGNDVTIASDLDLIISKVSGLQLADGAVTSTAAELNLLDGVAGLVQADFTKLAAIDSTAAELNLLDAVARGSIIYGNGSGASALLGKGAASTFLQSDGSDIAYVAMSGDATLSAGAITIADNAVSLAKMAGIARGSIISGDASGDPAALAVGSAHQFLQSDGADLAYVSMSGDATLAAGVLSIGATKVTDAMLNDDAATGLAGNGLAAASGVLSVGVDGSSIEINADALRVKALGITDAMLAGSITAAKMNNAIFADLETLGAPTADGEFIVGTGAGAFAYETGNTVRTSLALGTGSDVTFTSLTLSGDLTVEGTASFRHSDDLIITDKHIMLASGSTGKAASAGGGIALSYSTNNASYFEFVYALNGSGDASASGDIFQIKDSAAALIDLQAAVVYASSLVGTLGTAAQPNVTSLGLLTALDVDDVFINGNAITSNGDSLFAITAKAGQSLGLEAMRIDEGAVTGLTSVTSTAFVGDLTGDVTGTSSLVNVTDSTANTNFPIVFNDESDALLDDTGAFHYNPSTGRLTVSSISAAVVTAVASKADTDTLAVGINYFADMGSDGEDVVTLPSVSGVEFGQSIKVKAPSDCSGARTIKIKIPAFSLDRIDGAESIILESPFAAVELVAVAANLWRVF